MWTGSHATANEGIGKNGASQPGMVSDTTHQRSKEGWCNLATVTDLYSRRLIGRSVSKEDDSALVCVVLRGAILTRGGNVPEGTMHHSDGGARMRARPMDG